MIPIIQRETSFCKSLTVNECSYLKHVYMHVINKLYKNVIHNTYSDYCVLIYLKETMTTITTPLRYLYVKRSGFQFKWF